MVLAFLEGNHVISIQPVRIVVVVVIAIIVIIIIIIIILLHLFSIHIVHACRFGCLAFAGRSTAVGFLGTNRCVHQTW